MMNRSTGRPFTILALLAVVGCGANTGAADGATQNGNDATGADTANADAAGSVGLMASVTVVDGKLEIHADPDVKAAASAACTKRLAAGCKSAAANGAAAQENCVFAKVLGSGADPLKCKQQLLDLYAIENSATYVCDAAGTAQLADTGAWKVANSAYLDCVGLGGGGGFFFCDEGGEGKPHHCAHTVLGHEVVVECDGKQCVCSVDGVGGAPFPTTGPPYPSCTVLK